MTVAERVGAGRVVADGAANAADVFGSWVGWEVGAVLLEALLDVAPHDAWFAGKIDIAFFEGNVIKFV